MQANDFRTYKWVRCPSCGHKLFKDFGYSDVEIKCSSCGCIVTITGGLTIGCNDYYKRRKNNSGERRRAKHNLEG